MSSKGIILTVKDQILICSGLLDCFVGEVIDIIDHEEVCTANGLVMNLENSVVRLVLIKGSQKFVKAGYVAVRSFNFLKTKCGFGVLGTIISPLGDIINKSDFTEELLFKKSMLQSVYLNIFNKAPGIIARSSVRFPLLTGIAVIDCFLPIGRGQRQLIIGDLNTGKTSLAITIILNQRSLFNKVNSIWRALENSTSITRKHSRFFPCIYIFIGKKRSELLRIKYLLIKKKAIMYTCLVFSSCDDLAAIQYLAPYAGTAMGEWFRDKGYHALIIYDDLSEHAIAYRQLSLLLRRPPGREAYPGDIFYVHSSLLERCGQLARKLGNGSLTSFPIIETKCGDITSYIPTNVISITDGQIYLSKTLVNKAFFPAVDIAVSVSRVGSKAQYACLKFVSKKIKHDYNNYRAYESISKISTDLSPLVKNYIQKGLAINQFLKQSLYVSYKLYNQVFAFFLLSEGYLENINSIYITLFLNILFKGLYKNTFLKNKEHLLKYLEYSSIELMDSLLKIYSIEPFINDFHLIGAAYKLFFVNTIQKNITSDSTNTYVSHLSSLVSD